MHTSIIHDHVTIVLKRPRYPENIGSAARAMCNMGFSRLVLVDPENTDSEKMKKTATHEAVKIIENMITVSCVEQAVSDVEYVVGTTARLGRQRRKASNPSTISPHLVSLSQQNRIAVLFGPEDRGLENSDIALCDALIHIPTSGFSSINLAHAVMIICYELNSSESNSKKSPPRLACKRELEEMYKALEETFTSISLVHPQKQNYYLTAFRDMFSRTMPRAKDVTIMRSFLAKIRNYREKTQENKEIDDFLS